MEATQYINERLNDQIKWYDRKSRTNKKLHNILRFIEIVLALIIPFLSGYATEHPSFQLIIGIMGLAIAAITGAVSLLKFQENWVSYRSTAETLKHEKYFFMTASGPYKNDPSVELLAERVESAISSENTNWAQLIQTSQKETGKQPAAGSKQSEVSSKP